MRCGGQLRHSCRAPRRALQLFCKPLTCSTTAVACCSRLGRQRALQQRVFEVGPVKSLLPCLAGWAGATGRLPAFRAAPRQAPRRLNLRGSWTTPPGRERAWGLAQQPAPARGVCRCGVPPGAWRGAMAPEMHRASSGSLEYRTGRAPAPPAAAPGASPRNATGRQQRAPVLPQQQHLALPP